MGHSNNWESREITNILRGLGEEVVGIDWTDRETTPSGEFNLIFDIDENLARLAPHFPDGRKLLHLTGSYAPFQNTAEEKRSESLFRRRGVRVKPRRIIPNLDKIEESIKVADACSLIGNEFTLSTYPEEYQPKISLVTVSASPAWIKPPEGLIPEEKEFLWFFGGGALHKGLDLVLEVFANNPNLTLNVVGGVREEDDFFEAYKKELTELANIHLYGHLNPLGPEFKEIASKCFCFIAPSCSESISTAAATCLQVGLYPIVSRETGVDLLPGKGIFLRTCSIPEIEAALKKVYILPEDKLRGDIAALQQAALTRYSRENFSKSMREFMLKQLKAHV
jgi:glycosyltransferase involved in cell wall biosynthesis